MDGKFEGYVFIDVRGPSEFGVSHVAGSVNIPLGEISKDHLKLKDLDRSTDIVVYCGAGGRAQKAKEKLEAIGFSNVTNGINQREVEAKFFK